MAIAAVAAAIAIHWPRCHWLLLIVATAAATAAGCHCHGCECSSRVSGSSSRSRQQQAAAGSQQQAASIIIIQRQQQQCRGILGLCWGHLGCLGDDLTLEIPFKTSTITQLTALHGSKQQSTTR